MNMSKRNRVIAGFLAASSIALAVPLAAQARGGHHPGFEGGCDMRGDMVGAGMRGGDFGGFGAMRALDLSEAQQDKIFALRHDLAPKMREQMKAVREASVNLRELMEADKYDEARVKDLADARAAAMSEMTQMRLQTEHQVVQLLTEEQRAKLKEIKAQRMARDGDRFRGRGPGEGPGPKPDMDD